MPGLIQSRYILKIFLKRKSRNLYFKRFFFRCIEWTNWTYAEKCKWFLLTLILPKINFFCYIKYRICQNFRTLWRSCTKWPMKSGPMLLYLITCWTIQAGMTGQQPLHLGNMTVALLKAVFIWRLKNPNQSNPSDQSEYMFTLSLANKNSLENKQTAWSAGKRDCFEFAYDFFERMARVFRTNHRTKLN